MGKLVASKRPGRNQQEASKTPARGEQEASKRPARGQEASKTLARGQQEASKRPGRGTKWGGPYETPKPLKNKYFHEEKSPVLGALWKTDFLEKSSWGSLKLARSQEAGKRQARGQQEASKTPARGH